MDEKELMMPLELGYVREADKRKALVKKFDTACVAIFVTFKIILTHGHTCLIHTAFLNKAVIFYS